VIDFVDDEHGDCSPVRDFPWHTPGEAGWLHGDGGCLVDLPDSGTVWGDDLDGPGFQPPGDCADELDRLRATGAAVWVPVHDAHQHDGSGHTGYRVRRVAKFLVTGYYFGDDSGQRSAKSTDSGELPCQSDGGETRRCVSGFFVGASQPLFAIAGDAIVKLIG